jgi:hypothetical protein
LARERGLPTICYQGPNVFDYLDRVGIRMDPWVLVVQTVDVGHEKKEVGMDHCGGDS